MNRSLLGALALYFALTAGILVSSWPRTGGDLVYVLDDPYIHMAMARNLAAHGVWGVTPHAFTSASSSPLWTLTIAGIYAVTGPRVAVPFVLDLLLGALILVLVDSLLCRGPDPWGPRARFLSLAFVTLVTPLPALVMTGQEHMLQILLVLVLIDRLARALDGEGTSPTLVAFLAGALVATRYEGLFLIALAVVWLRLAGRASHAWATLAGGLVPFVAFGLYSRMHGWHFLPQPVLVKGNRAVLGALRDVVVDLAGGVWSLDRFTEGAALLGRLAGYDAVVKLIASPQLLFPVLAGLVIFLTSRARMADGRTGTRILLAVALTLVHLTFAQTGWFFRYEAYLLAALVVAAWTSVGPRQLAEWPPESGGAGRAVVLILGAVLLQPLVHRAYTAVVMPRYACGNIHEQQVQIARFLAAHRRGEVVALNDIGAVNFFADIDCVDLFGLADRELGDLRIQGGTTRDDLERVTQRRGARLAVLYESWFARGGGLPARWKKVATWTISDNLVCGDATAAFWALVPEEVSRLRADLEAFAPSLPATVAVHYE